ncbi:hypothetical protein [Rubinisphaera italica]|uniref:Stigma-specific protein, Stig1 n=1 Tax=Rubinisphaera italica TaxID=2527969 RepID=A0A5C5XLX9_9PLAN|nr:hypothetical protein [Rubinisphaera italica]TWT63461.1 hypothetical protein Pan54_42140 [Rubinisphaera italica]
MTKSMNRLMMLGVCGLLAVTTTATAEAGIIPWTYNAIFGPVGSTFAARPTYGYGANYGARYGGNACCGTTANYGGNSCCGTTSSYGYTTSYSPYYAGYTPYYAGYSSYYGSSCNNCGTCNTCNSGCNSCGYGCASNGCSNCASGDCNSGLTPAAGTTSTPQSNNSPTPTTTFKSTEPTVNPNAGESSDSKPNYEPSNNENGFEMPEQEKKSEDTNAPKFEGFNNSSRESLKLPSAPMVPVEQANPEPTQLEEFRAPRLDLIPAPVAVDDSQISWSVTKAPTRVVRNARYSIPTVARYTPAQLNDLVPPMPIQVAEK